MDALWLVILMLLVTLLIGSAVLQLVTFGEDGEWTLRRWRQSR